MSLDFDYHPHQGKVEHSDSYLTLAPAGALRHWVHSFWQLAVPEGKYNYRSIPDNCVDLIFDLTASEEPFIVTPFTRAKVFEIIGPVSFFGIRFNILGQHGLFSFPMGEWKTPENVTSSEGLIPREFLLVATDLVSKNLDFRSCCRFFSKRLLEHLEYVKIDNRLIKFIRYSHANADSSADFSDKQCSGFGVSARQLRRLTHLYLGLSPQSFYKVFRFQVSLSAMRDKNSPSVWGVSYYDQSHFIRNFKSMAGVTPTEFMDLSVLYNKA